MIRESMEDAGLLPERFAVGRLVSRSFGVAFPTKWLLTKSSADFRQRTGIDCALCTTAYEGPGEDMAAGRGILRSLRCGGGRRFHRVYPSLWSSSSTARLIAEHQIGYTVASNHPRLRLRAYEPVSRKFRGLLRAIIGFQAETSSLRPPRRNSRDHLCLPCIPRSSPRPHQVQVVLDRLAPRRGVPHQGLARLCGCKRRSRCRIQAEAAEGRAGHGSQARERDRLGSSDQRRLDDLERVSTIPFTQLIRRLTLKEQTRCRRRL